MDLWPSALALFSERNRVLTRSAEMNLPWSQSVPLFWLPARRLVCHSRSLLRIRRLGAADKES
jgi:hypothetical protein